MKLVILILSILLINIQPACSQDTVSVDEYSKTQVYIAYDFGEAMFNNFQSLSGEIGLHRSNHQLIRLVHMNVNFTEKHLSSDFAVPVQGENVEGSMLGFEAFYSFPIKKWESSEEILYLSPSLGCYRNKYWHTVLDQRFEHQSPTVGAEISFREINPFNLNGLYYAVSIPIRIHFDPHEKVELGQTTIAGNRIDNNIWFFIGYQF